MERIKELCKEYGQRDIFNMDEWLFFQSFDCKGFSSEGKESQGWKKSKQRIIFAFFISADRKNVGKSIMIWRRKKPRKKFD